ncbi:MAG TPA: hypothetical protein VJ761_21350 [Ktedonobacteraceae bacterium]|nr:hypothetical protein [Ktedonobacteraceae bacterium]
MGRTAKPPKGFYTAGQAVKKLHMSRSSLYNLVERGQIKKITPPGKTDGFYAKEDVDRLAIAQEAFILQYASDTSIFALAQEEDLEGIADLNAELLGGTRASRYALRVAQYRSNPEIFHVLKQDGIVVGYVGIFPLKPEAIDKIMAGMSESKFRMEVLAPEYITQFKPGEADHIFLIIGVRQGVKKSKLYGARVIAGTIQFLERLAHRRVFIKKAYGTSRTELGIKLSRGLGFRQIRPAHEEDEGLLRFELDLETSDHPLLREYHNLAKQANTSERKKQRSMSPTSESER